VQVPDQINCYINQRLEAEKAAVKCKLLRMKMGFNLTIEQIEPAGGEIRHPSVQVFKEALLSTEQAKRGKYVFLLYEE
jgi:hypothetical protein